MIKNIIFDLGGVIVRLNDVSVPIQRFEEIGFKDASKYLGVYGQSGIFQELESGAIDAEEFLAKLAELSGRESVSFEEGKYAWMGYKKDVPPERLQNLLKLRKDGYKLYLLSNLNPFFTSFTRSTEFSGDGHSIDHYLDHAFYSYELKDYKPAPSIFQKVMDQAGLKAEECIFVDDGPRNVAAAVELGMKGLVVPKDEDWMPSLTAMLQEDKEG